MGQNFIACDRGQVMLLQPSLTDWLAEDHLVWTVLGAVEEMDLDAFYGAYRANGQGRAAYDPAIRPVKLAQLHPRHRVKHEPREVTIRQPIPHVGRHQKRPITVTTNEVLSHLRMVLNPPDSTVITRQPLAFAIARSKPAREQKQSCRAQGAHAWIWANSADWGGGG